MVDSYCYLLRLTESERLLLHAKAKASGMDVKAFIVYRCLRDDGVSEKLDKIIWLLKNDGDEV